ncbi:MAG: cbb3-type cytochrome oxidase assembly protein CcoS [Bdellovibrionales bacterium]|nr:cbb3-type cytochrome oxidase assembly protein CcoS [Bdellovibrionales bacterium]
MSVLIVLIPIALALGGIALGAFIHAAISGQYEDLETPAYKILIEEPSERKNR